MITAGLGLVEAEGIGALSLRRLARDAGVSSGAPYRHFSDLAALFAAIIVDGHEMLLARLRAVCAAAPDATAALRDMLVGYAEFAAEHPAHLRVMLRPEVGEPAKHPDVSTSGAAVVDVLRSAVVAAQREGTAPPGDPEPVLQLFWSLAVGYVTLWLDGPVEARCTALGTTPEQMIRRVASTVEELLRRPAA